MLGDKIEESSGLVSSTQGYFVLWPCCLDTGMKAVCAECLVLSLGSWIARPVVCEEPWRLLVRYSSG